MYSPLLNFLKNSNKETDFDRDLDRTLIKCELKALILQFAKGPGKNSISLELDNSISDENPFSIAKKLFDATEECKSPIKSIMFKEIDLFTSGGDRGEYL